MERRVLVVLTVAIVAVVVVGLSAAATMSRGDSKQPARALQPEKSTENAQTATKAAVTAAQRKRAKSPAVTSSEPQSAKEAESYWTKERMDDAQPMQKTRPGGSPSFSPAPSGSSAPGSAPTTTSTPQKSRTKTSKSAANTGVVAGPAATPNPDYWDDEAMSGAQPLDKTRPGGSGSGSSAPSGPTAPGSPPS